MIESLTTYIYGMDKYNGLNVVESVVSPAPKAKVKRPKSTLGIKIIISLAAVGLIAVIAFAPIPGMEVIRGAVKTIMCYDLFGRSDIGSLPILAGVFG